MQNKKHWWTVAAMACLLVAAASPAAFAKKLADAEIFFEINDTDGDAGIQVFIDGDGWDVMEMRGPNGLEFSIAAQKGIGMQGITEFFFESAEPSFDVQSLDELLALFPEGEYKFKGFTTEGRRLKGRAELTHALPAAPVFIFPLEGDEVDPDNAVFSWEEVPDPPGSEIEEYEVVVECEEPGSEMFVVVPAEITQVTVPPEVLQDQDECKWEVLALEESGNKTITESPFGIQ